MALLHIFYEPNLANGSGLTKKSFKFLLFRTQPLPPLIKDLRLHHLFFVPDSSYALLQQLRADQRVFARLQRVGSLPLHWHPTEQASAVSMHMPQLIPQVVLLELERSLAKIEFKKS